MRHEEMGIKERAQRLSKKGNGTGVKMGWR